MKLVFFLLFFISHLRISSSGPVQVNSMESVPDLFKSMYMVVDGYPCVRLLNLSGEIGCSNPGRDKIVAPIRRYENAKELAEPTAILVSLDEMQDLFSRISNDSSFAKNIGGVLVESGSKIRDNLKGFSPAQKFPQAEFAPYDNTNYEWNPIGSGIMHRSYNFPVLLLSESSTLTLAEAAVTNEGKRNGYTTNVAEFDLVMQTTKVGTHDSESCLREGSCLPLGGYSVWSSIPAINVSSPELSKPIIFVVSSMDSASFFRDKSLGADSPISGLISMLVAVDALSRLDVLHDLSRQLVFLAFTGEAWGYLGSRRFLLELDQQSDAVYGLNSSLVQLVLEIGSVGKGFNQGSKTFFAHTSAVSPAVNGTLDALRIAKESLKSEGFTLSSASPSNPGIPPSSLMAFLRRNSSTAGVVLEDFDTIFSNQFYQSHLDDLSNINSSAIASAASLVARTLYILANDSKDLNTSALNAINANHSLVEELMDCLLKCDPGLSCELVKNYISPSGSCPNHYVGVVLGEPSSTSLEYVDDISRFIWNFLADRTSFPKGNANSLCSQDCSKNGGVCIRAETNGKGECVFSTTRYVPAYSTRLKFEAGTWTVLPPNSSNQVEMLDPVWTESNWEAIGLRIYTVQNAAYDRLILLGGVAITALAYVGILIARAFITKALKRD